MIINLSLGCIMAKAFLHPLMIIFILHQIMIPTTMANPRADLIYKTCGKGHVQNVSEYNENYSVILRSMQHGMSVNKFALGEEGNEPNRVYVLAHCMSDLSKSDCAICFSKINTMLPSCLPAPDGLVLFDGCFMRMDNHSFFHESFPSKRIMNRCSANNEDTDQYRHIATDVMNKVTNNAPENNGFDDGHQTISQGLSVFAMANCWRNLDRSSCASCLLLARESALDCLPSVEGRALFTGCYLRYSDYEFVNKPSFLSSPDGVYMYLIYVLVAVVICLLALLIGFFLGVTISNRRSARDIKSNEEAMESSTMGSLHFKYSMLQKATENFSESNKIGQGGFGEVFKGVLPDGREMAIKRLFTGGKLRGLEVSNEVDIISHAQHKNLVRYFGCCFTNEDTLLIYEYLPNKSLDHILFDSQKKKELGWKKRLGIIKGTAEGLEYLHKDCEGRIVHLDIKASNILLDVRHRPKISDFGLAKFYSSDQASVGPVIAGTLGYMAPEYLGRGRLTEKVDVYSYGVLVLEIVSGFRNNSYQPEDSLDTLVTATWKHFQENTQSEIIDRDMETEDDDLEEIQRVIQIGLLCTQESPGIRPTMSTILQMLRHKDMELPNPTKPPFMVDTVLIGSNSFGSHQRNRTVSADSCKYFDAYGGSPDVVDYNARSS